ncbi:nicotinate-nucleotide--dimethylbenzimidazole phosphoribosyltransferase, partial [Streptomyces caniscabiei]
PDAATAAAAPADPAATPVVAEPEQATAAPEQQAPATVADAAGVTGEQVFTDAAGPQAATVAPDEGNPENPENPENSVAPPARQTAEVPPSAAPDTDPAQGPVPSEPPAAEEPQPTETGAAEPLTQDATATEAAQPHPEAVAEGVQPTETDQPGAHPTVQAPQADEPAAAAAEDVVTQEQEQEQDQDQDQDQTAVQPSAQTPAQDPAQDQDQLVAAQNTVTAPQPEPAQLVTADALVEPGPTHADTAAEPTDGTDAQAPAPAEELTDEAPPPADPVEPTADPASVDPTTAEPLAADTPAAPASRIDAPQGAVIQAQPQAEPDAPPLVATSQEPASEADADRPAPPQGMVVPPLPEDAGPTPAPVEFPAAEGQTDVAAAGRDAAEDGREPAGEPVAMVPAPRGSEAETIVVPQPLAAAADAHPEVVQNAEDLDTRAADQEDGETTAPEAEAVESAAAEESTAPVDEASEDVRDDVRQPTGPAAPPYDDAEREAVLKVMRERRDIRNGFRDDPIPHDVLLRVLEAAHTAPSVGHSQPWDFVVIRSAETRRTMHELAQRQREAYAKSLPKGRAKQFKELKIEAILDTPVNIVVTADPTRGGRHTLGRHTQPQMAPYSSALAVENLWLAARAEGLGVGWVSFFDEREMVRALGLPEHLEVVAYLCVGYVDEFPEEPELMQAGWAKRRPLSWVVHEETYGRRALPGAEPHDLLAETVAGIRPLDAKALGEAWERQKRMTKPAGALGMLEIISAQLSGLSRQCPPPIPEPAAVAIFAGDHGVHAQGVTPWPQEVTAQMVANFLGGGAVCNAFAAQVGAEVCVVDVGVASDLPATPGLLPRKIRAGTSDMTTGPAMTREEAKQAIEVGIETARDLVAAGNKALLTGEMGIANTTASAALIAAFTGADPAEVTGRGTGINDETLARKTEVVRRAIELHQPDPADPIGVLAAIGGFEHAAMVGLLLGGASLRTPVILDGVSAGAAALVARAIAPEVLAACIAGHRSAEPGHVAALQKLGLRPLVDLDLRLGEGTGALLALPVVQSAARAMHEVATFDSAGVTEK